jgi:hypothetical protein
MCTISIASCRTMRTTVCWFVRHSLLRPLKIRSVSAGHVGITVVAAVRATLPPASGNVSSPSSNVSPLRCVLWLPGSRDEVSACHEARYKEITLVKSLLLTLSVPLSTRPRSVWLDDTEQCPPHHASQPPPLHRFQHYR